MNFFKGDEFMEDFLRRQSKSEWNSKVKKRGKDIRMNIEVGFRESVLGEEEYIQKRVEVERGEKCRGCKGNGWGKDNRDCTECGGTG